ncbi:MAG: NUDIX domain-containing protein [Candidatus Paceibacterota bacterium]|jgi:8-oxo-dGTP diphosphatase
MKIATHIGNVTIVLDRTLGQDDPQILIGLKKPKGKKDGKRKRKRIGVGRWVPPGGATENDDKSQKHAAQRELRQETGLDFPLKLFQKVGVLRGYINSTDIPTWLVHIYLVDASEREKTFVPNEEYVEMRWFKLSKLPFEKMLQGDRNWLPKIAKGQKLSIRIVANENADRAFSIDIRPIHSFN